MQYKSHVICNAFWLYYVGSLRAKLEVMFANERGFGPSLALEFAAILVDVFEAGVSYTDNEAERVPVFVGKNCIIAERWFLSQVPVDVPRYCFFVFNKLEYAHRSTWTSDTEYVRWFPNRPSVPNLGSYAGSFGQFSYRPCC